jgi:hypothetical protein
MNLHSMGQEILYQGKDGVSVMPSITGNMARRILAGDSVLQIGVCVIYGSLSTADPRRWELMAFYEFEPGTPFAKTFLLDEAVVPLSQTTCNSKVAKERWLASPALGACSATAPSTIDQLFEPPASRSPAN